ncbi:MAG: hypothetical protein MJ252_07280, partial [archaeon]|nr:hypothetical protein [archaeon]
MHMDFLIDTYYAKNMLLKSNTTQKNTLVPNLDYIYYLDLRDYSLNEENLFEINFGNAEDYETLLGYNEMQEEVDPNVTTLEFKNFTRTRASLDSTNLYIPFKRRWNTDKYLVIKLKYTVFAYHEVTLNSLPRVEKYPLKKELFEDNLYTINNIVISSKMPRLILIEYSEELNYNYNLIFKIPMDNIATFTRDNLIKLNGDPNEDSLLNSLFIFQKNDYLRERHIFINLLGHLGSTSIKIGLVSEDIELLSKVPKLNQPYVFTLTNCAKTTYMVRTFDNGEKNNHYLITKKFYGKSELSYSLNTTSPLIDKVDTIPITEEFMNLNSFNNDFLKLKCNTPSSYLINYISFPEAKEIIKDGEEFFLFIQSTQSSVKIDLPEGSDTKMYQLELRYYGPDSVDVKLDSYMDKLSSENPLITRIFPRQSDLTLELSTEVEGANSFIKVSLSSWNSYYKIVEGNTDIPIEGRRSLLKIRNDIYYDNIVLNFITKQSISNFELAYSWNNYKDQNYIPFPLHKEKFTRGITLLFANPYNKYYSNINEDDLYYFAVDFLSENVESYYIFAEIRYVDSDSSILAKLGSYTVAEQGLAYRLEGDKKYKTNDRIVFNINTCQKKENKDKSISYKLINYYELLDNTLGEAEFTEKRNVFNFTNHYNGSKFRIKNDFNESVTVNYFFTELSYMDIYKFTSDYSIQYHKSDNPKISFNSYVKEGPDVTVLYSIYILPSNSEDADNICVLSQEKADFTAKYDRHGTVNEFDLTGKIKPGKYILNIIAKSTSETFPMTTIYESVKIEIDKKTDSTFWIITIVVFVFILLLSILYFYRLKKKKDASMGLSSVEGAKRLMD